MCECDHSIHTPRHRGVAPEYLHLLPTSNFVVHTDEEAGIIVDTKDTSY